MLCGKFVKRCVATPSLAESFGRMSALVMACVTGGCALFGPRVSVREAVDVAVSASMEASSLAERSRPAPVPRLPLKNVCVELNANVTILEFLPAVQSGLKRRGVTSRVYEPGTAPQECDAILNYEATRDWDMRLASNDSLPYMSYARITLRRDGKLLSSASYGVRGLGFDKWSSTSTKIEPMLDTLLAGGS